MRAQIRDRYAGAGWTRRLAGLVVVAFLILPGLSIFRACFCGHGSGAAEHHAAGCSCPVHAARESGGEPCHGHAPLRRRRTADSVQLVSRNS